MKLENKIDVKFSFLIFSMPGMVISLIQAVLEIISYQNYRNSIEAYQNDNNIVINPHWAINSIYQLWIGNNLHNNYSKILFYVLPIEISLFCFYLCNLRRSELKTNNGLKELLHISILSGSIASATLLFNFFVLLLFIPVVSPDSIYNIYYSYFSKDFLSHIYYTNPLVYVLFYLFLNWVYFGLIGCISILLYLKIPKMKKATLFLPASIMIFIELIKNRFCGAYSKFEMSPLSIVFPAKSHYTNWSIIIVEILILCLIIKLLSKVGLIYEKKDS